MFGWVWFGEWLDGLGWLGAGLIVLPTTLVSICGKVLIAKRKVLANRLVETQ